MFPALFCFHEAVKICLVQQADNSYAKNNDLLSRMPCFHNACFKVEQIHFLYIGYAWLYRLMSCRAIDTQFLNVFSLTTVTHICEGGWYFVGSIFVNIILAYLSIFSAQQRYRYERQIQFLTPKRDATNKMTENWKESFRYYTFFLFWHQFLQVVNFVFLVHTNIVMLVLSAILNIVIRMYIYYYDVIESDSSMLYRPIEEKTRLELY